MTYTDRPRVMRCVFAFALAGLLARSAAAQREAEPAEGKPPVPGAPSGVTAFVDVAVVPMDSDRVLPHQTVLVRGGRIVALGPAATVVVPPAAVRIDARGKYLMPGLGACHAHISTVWSPLANTFPPKDPRYSAFTLLLFLADGVTVLRNADYVDFDNSPAFRLNGRDLLQLRRQAAAGQLWSPRLYVAGQWAPLQYTSSGGQTFYGPREGETWPAPRLDSVAAYVAAYKAAGYDFIKLHEESAEITDSVYAAARRIGIQVGGHVKAPFAHALAGQQVADHADPLGGWPDVRDTSAGWREGVASSAAARRQAGMWTCISAGGGGEAPIVRALTDSGAGALLGDDGWPGNERLPYYVSEARLTPYQALVLGTKNFGQYLRTLDPHGDETGTIAVGQRADLLLLTGNPLDDVRYAANAVGPFFQADPDSARALLRQRTDPAVVMIGGRWLRRAELDRRVAVVKQFWTLFRATSELTSRLQADSGLTGSARRQLARLDSLHREQQLALATRFALAKTAPAGGPDSLRGPRLLTELFARQLGDVRVMLPAAARLHFDAQARSWLAARAKEGYRIRIAGVAP